VRGAGDSCCCWRAVGQAYTMDQTDPAGSRTHQPTCRLRAAAARSVQYMIHRQWWWCWRWYGESASWLSAMRVFVWNNFCWRRTKRVSISAHQLMRNRCYLRRKNTILARQPAIANSNRSRVCWCWC